MATKKAKTTEIDNYDGKSIRVLKYPLNVQERPQMFIGPVDDQGPITCLREILNNSVDEHLSGNCTHISVVRSGLLEFTVFDNGRGVPFDEHDGKNSLQRIFGVLNAGRNFDAKTVYSTGLNGVGSTVVNALSEKFEVVSRRGKEYGKIIFNEGIESSLKIGKFKDVPEAPFNKSSTKVTFNLEARFFDEGMKPSSEELFNLVHEAAYLNNGLTVSYIDGVEKTKNVWCYKDGVCQYLKDHVVPDSSKMVTPVISLGQDTIKDTKVEIAFAYDTSFGSEEITSFCNTIRTPDGGSHVTGFKRSISQKLFAYLSNPANKMCREKITNEDIYSGLKAVVSVFVFNPKYTSQTKTCLKNSEVMGHVVSFTNTAIDEWLDSSPKELKAIAIKIDSVAKARIAQKRALESVKKDSSNALTSLSNIAKFSDCEEQNSGRTELFLVEGDSAGGTANSARDKKFQAIFRLKGKILNTVDKTLHVARANKEVDDLISTLRCGAGATIDMDKLKFDKVVALCDADDDGSHIELLILTLMHTHLRPIIEQGHFYIALSPLFKVSITGKPVQYLNTTNDLAKFFSGEMNNWYTFTNEETGKKLSTKASTKFVSDLIDYHSSVQRIAETYGMKPALFEQVFVHLFNPEPDTDEPSFPDFFEAEGLEFKYLGNERWSVSGIVELEDDEKFVSTIINESSLDFIVNLYDSLITNLLSVNITDRKENEVKVTDYFSFVDKSLKDIKRTARVSRLKGLGEVNADELWDTTLNPETRRMVQVQLTEDSEVVVENFMSSRTGKSDIRKEFLKAVFSETIHSIE